MSLSSTIPPQFAPVSGGANGTLGGGQGYSSANGFGAGGNAAPALSGLVGVAVSYNTGSVAGVLAGGSGESYGSGFGGTQYSITSGTLGGLAGNSGGGDILTPQFAVANGALQPIGGFGIALAGMTGVVQGTLLGLRGFAATTGRAEVRSDPGTLGSVDASGDWNGREGGYLRNLVGQAFNAAFVGGFVHVDLPGRPRLFSIGQAHELTDAGGNPVVGYGGHASIPGAITLNATGGVAVRATLPVPTLTCTGTTTILGTVRGTVPVPTLEAAGTTTIVARLHGSLPGKPSLVARSGARAAAKLGVPALVATGTTSRLARAQRALPALTLNASGTAGALGSVSGVLGGLQPGNSAVVVVTATPRIVLRATGSPSVTIAYEAYSIALIPAGDGAMATATTHYTNFPFDRIVRFGSKYYGIAADGIYELDGDDYDGTPIVSVVQTAESDFGKKQPKRPVAAWMAGTLSDDLKLSCLTDGSDVSGTQYRERIVKGNAARRVVFGKGARGHWLAYKFTNASGKDFEIEEFDPEVEILRREV